MGFIISYFNNGLDKQTNARPQLDIFNFQKFDLKSKATKTSRVGFSPYTPLTTPPTPTKFLSLDIGNMIG